jgi:GAF domain-containing protein
MTLRRRTLLLVIPLLAITVASTAAIIAASGRSTIVDQTIANGIVLTEQFAYAIEVGEEIRVELEALYAQQQAAKTTLAPLLAILAQATNQTPEQIEAQLNEIMGSALLEDFAARRMGKGVWIGQFIDRLISKNIAAIWVLDQNLNALATDVAPGLSSDTALEDQNRAMLETAMRERSTQAEYDGTYTKVAAYIPDGQGNVIGVTLIYSTADYVRQAINRQLNLTVVVAVVALGVGALASVWVARSLSHPLLELTDVAQQIETGDYTLQQAEALQNTGGKSEISHLSRILGKMAQEIILRFREALQRYAEIQTVYQIAQAITASSTNPDETLQTILARVEHIIPYEGGEICLYVPEENGLRVRAWRGQPGYDTRGRVYKMGEGFTGGIAARRESLLVPDIEKHPTIKAVHTQLGEKSYVRSFVGVPLLVGDRLVGTLELVSTEPNRFDDHMQQLLETISLQAAVAIETAQRVEKRERELQEQIAQLKLVIQINEERRSRQVAEVTETDYFQDLQQKARDLRKRAR